MSNDKNRSAAPLDKSISNLINGIEAKAGLLLTAVDEMRATHDAFAQFSVEIAKRRKAMFDAHVAAGFDKAQALFLCREN